MATLTIHVDDRDMETLKREAEERDRTVEDLAECAVSEACCDVRRSQPMERKA